MTIGERIREARTAKGLTQEQLAEQVHVTKHVGHLAQDIAHTIRRKILRKAIHNVHDRGDAEALTGFRKYAIPSVYKGVLTVEKIYLSVMTEFYTDYALHVGALSAAGRTG